MKKTALIILIFSSFIIAQSKYVSEEKFITTTDSIKLYVKISGVGKPCIFIHGGPGAWSFNFEALGGNKLEDTLTMVYYDQRGCGRSENAANNNYSLERMIKDIEEIRIALNLKKPLIMSHSFGGIIAINYAEKYQKKIDGLILLNSTLNLSASMQSIIENGINLLGIKETAAFYDGNYTITERFGLIAKRLNETNSFYKLQFESKEALDKVDSIDALNTFDNEYGMKVWDYDEYYYDYTKLTSVIGVPVLIIAGTGDEAVGQEHYKLFNFPNETLCLIDSRHIIYLERNKEFTECVKNFLKEKRLFFSN